MEIPTLIGFISNVHLLNRKCVLSLLSQRTLVLCGVRPFSFSSLRLCEVQEDAIKLLTLMVQIFFLMWSSYNLMRYELWKTALMTLVISCSTISVMQLLGVAQTQWEFYDVGSRTSVLGQNPNNMANNISLGLVALMGFAFGRNKTSPWVKYVAPL